MAAIYLQHLRDQLQSLRFQLSLLVVVAFFATSGFIYSWKTVALREEVAIQESSAARRLGAIERLNDAVNRTYTATNHPLWTEFVTEGGVDWFDDRSLINPRSGEGAPMTSKNLTTNFNIETFEVLDWTLIGRLIISFVCVVLAYDAVSAERERGTLRLVFANSISRVRFLAGKFLATWTCVLVPVVVGALLALTILSLHGAVDLGARTLYAVGCYFAATGAFTALVLLLCLATSALVASSATSLALIMLVWVACTVVVPQIAYLIGVNAFEAPGWRERGDAIWRGVVVQELAEEGISPRGREHGAHDGYAVERQFAQRLHAVEEEMWQRRREAFADQTRQYELISWMSLLSPGHAYSQSMESLLGTGLTRYWVFVERTVDYGQSLRDFLRARDASDPDSPHITFVADYMSQRELDHRHLPTFPHEPIPLGEGLRRGGAPVIVLLLELLAAILFAQWAVRRMDLT